MYTKEQCQQAWKLLRTDKSTQKKLANSIYEVIRVDPDVILGDSLPSDEKIGELLEYLDCKGVTVALNGVHSIAVAIDNLLNCDEADALTEISEKVEIRVKIGDTDWGLWFLEQKQFTDYCGEHLFIERLPEPAKKPDFYEIDETE